MSLRDRPFGAVLVNDSQELPTNRRRGGRRSAVLGHDGEVDADD